MFPILIIDPSRTTVSVARMPSTKVPFVEPKSLTTTSDPRTIAQCNLLTLASSI
jgi:hypothetical protein